MHLQQTFNAAILTTLYPRSQIDIFVEVRLVQTLKALHIQLFLDMSMEFVNPISVVIKQLLGNYDIIMSAHICKFYVFRISL